MLKYNFYDVRFVFGKFSLHFFMIFSGLNLKFMMFGFSLRYGSFIASQIVGFLFKLALRPRLCRAALDTEGRL